MLDVDAIEQRFVGASPDSPEEEAILQLIAEIRRLRDLCGEAADNLSDAYDAYRPFYLGEIRDRLRAASKGEL